MRRQGARAAVWLGVIVWALVCAVRADAQSTGSPKPGEVDGGAIVNAFVEPQMTIYHKGQGLPSLQVFVGLNFQFPKR